MLGRELGSLIYEPTYYDILGNQPDATPVEQDKHPTQSRSKFQEVGEAYQVPADPQPRDKYHQFGKDYTTGIVGPSH